MIFWSVSCMIKSFEATRNKKGVHFDFTSFSKSIGTGQFGQAMAWPLLALANPTIKGYEDKFTLWSKVSGAHTHST